jgi:uncharacterized protein (UPF0332 family)
VSAEGHALACHRIQRAAVACREGDLLAEQGAYPGAISRYYYAAFHAARALLATRHLDSARHAGVIALFQQHFVKTGDFPAEIARSLPRAFEKRLSSDYSDFIEISADEVERARSEVHAFVDTCRQLLRRTLPDR